MRLPILAASILSLAAGTAVAQPQSGQPFRVFFDWGKPELTRDAQTILGEVVTAYEQQRPEGVRVAAHTDRSGSSDYNRAASKRRAEAVMAYLVAHGIPAKAFTLVAYGESEPIVPTEDGVREVQNRRAEISFVGGSAPAGNSRQSSIVDGAGKTVGAALMTLSPEGGSLAIEATGLPPGIHGMHLHAIGRCDGPDFASAGPHWNPTNRQHGFKNPNGHHLGDLPEIMVGTGVARTSVQLPPGSLDEDGFALVIHAATDDDMTDPSGNSGARIACAAFNR